MARLVTEQLEDDDASKKNAADLEHMRVRQVKDDVQCSELRLAGCMWIYSAFGRKSCIKWKRSESTNENIVSSRRRVRLMPRFVCQTLLGLFQLRVYIANV